MIKQITCFLPALFVSTFLYGQAERTKSTRSSGDILSAGASIHLPMGNFSTSHVLGIGLEASPAVHTFGLLHFKKIAFTYNAGIAYFIGKKNQVSGYSYNFPGFTFIHGYAGLLYNPLKKLNVNLLAGPALGIYKKNTRFNIGARLEGSYYIGKTSIAAGPLLNMILEPGTQPLWSVGLKFTMDL